MHKMYTRSEGENGKELSQSREWYNREERIIYIVFGSIDHWIMPFYRIMLVTRNDLAVASIYNSFVETAKYVMNNGGVFQRIYNTGEHLFRYLFFQFYSCCRYPLFCKANSKTYKQGPTFFLQFCSSPQVMEKVCGDLKNSTFVWIFFCSLTSFCVWKRKRLILWRGSNCSHLLGCFL